MISKIQRSWRQICDVTTTGTFQTGLETTICRWLQGPSQLSTPSLFPTHPSHPCCHEQAGWGRQNWACPRARETLGTPLITAGLALTSGMKSKDWFRSPPFVSHVCSAQCAAQPSVEPSSSFAAGTNGCCGYNSTYGRTKEPETRCSETSASS